MKLTHISKTYHNKHHDVLALDDINLTFNNHGMTFIVGASGCGKTTLLNIMAGNDTAFEGSLEIDGKVECIQQDTVLMENLSVYDNLKLVSDDVKQIDELLIRFHLPHKHQKVKKLSGGEKQRVQVIRSLLTKVQYLICDEPTASLDHDNGELIMELLKEISHDIAVIVITHDIALVQKYSDRVIQMGKGVVLQDTPLENKDLPLLTADDKKSFKKQMAVLLKLLKSRWQESLFRYFLLFFAVLIVFVLISIYPALNDAIKGVTNWRMGKNVLMSEPITETKIELSSSDYLYYDTYQKSDIYLAHENIDGLLAYRLGWDSVKYKWFDSRSSYIKQVDIDGLKDIVNTYKKEYLETGQEPFHWYEQMFFSLQEYENDPSSQERKLYSDYTNFIGLSTIKNHPFTFPITEFTRLLNLDVTPYQLFPNTELDLIYGSMPKAYNEIIISKNVAEELCKTIKCKSLEELVGKEMMLYMLPDVVSRSNLDDIIENEDREEDIILAEFPMIISGITYMESQLENQIFFIDGGFDQVIESEYRCQCDIATYHYASFLVDPKLDCEKIGKQMDNVLNADKSRFVMYNAIDYVQESYQNPTNIFIFSSFALATIIVLYVMMQWLLNKRMKKETLILKRYQYQALMIQIGIMLVLLGLVAIIQLALLSYLCDGLNQLANRIGIANIVEYNLMTYASSFIITLVGVIALEGGSYAVKIKKHS
jgi:ABC-type antimicrobial peptide transport system, ATPase component